MPRVAEKDIAIPTNDYLLVTVGTTKFEHLVKEINSFPETIIKLCYSMNIREIFLQIGSSSIEPFALEAACQEYKPISNNDNQEDSTSRYKTSPYTLKVNWVSYAQGFQAFLQNATLVISHAGAGTILERLRSTSAPGGNASTITPNIPKLFVVINELLMDNHQEELAEAFAMDNYLFYSNCSGMIDAIEKADWNSLKLYPPPNTNAIIGVVAQSVNYSLNGGAVVPIVQ